MPLILLLGIGNNPPIPPPTANLTLAGFKKVNLAANKDADEYPVIINFSFNYIIN